MDIPNGLLLKLSYPHNGFLQHFEINSIHVIFLGDFWICSSVLPRKKSSPRVSTHLWWFKITGMLVADGGFFVGKNCRAAPMTGMEILKDHRRCHFGGWRWIDLMPCSRQTADVSGEKTGMFVPRSFWKKDLLLSCDAITTMTHYHCLWLSQSYIQFPNAYCFIQNLFR